jgi:hypothetical protein
MPEGLFLGNEIDPATHAARALEKAIKDRLPEELAQAVWTDPVTKAASAPGEDRDAFVARLAAGGGSPQAAKLRDRLEKNTAEARVEALKAEIALLEQELSAHTAMDPARFQSSTVVPARTQVKLLRYGMVWVY